jgi:hypothetical protein
MTVRERALAAGLRLLRGCDFEDLVTPYNSRRIAEISHARGTPLSRHAVARALAPTEGHAFALAEALLDYTAGAWHPERPVAAGEDNTFASRWDATLSWVERGLVETDRRGLITIMLAAAAVAPNDPAARRLVDRANARLRRRLASELAETNVSAAGNASVAEAAADLLIEVYWGQMIVVRHLSALNGAPSRTLGAMRVAARLPSAISGGKQLSRLRALAPTRAPSPRATIASLVIHDMADGWWPAVEERLFSPASLVAQSKLSRRPFTMQALRDAYASGRGFDRAGFTKALEDVLDYGASMYAARREGRPSDDASDAEAAAYVRYGLRQAVGSRAPHWIHEEFSTHREGVPEPSDPPVRDLFVGFSLLRTCGRRALDRSVGALDGDLDSAYNRWGAALMRALANADAESAERRIRRLATPW